MRRRLVGVVAGLALLYGFQGVARPATNTPKTPPPTVTVTMATPVGTQSNPTLGATWNVVRPGIQGWLSVQGPTVDTPALLPDVPAAPTPVPFLTTVTATWTSKFWTLRAHDLGANVILSWSDGMPPGATGSRQLLRVRYGDSKGRWGRWITLYDKPFTDSTATFLTTGGPAPEIFDPIGYPGKVPAKNIRAQFSLTDTLPQGSLLQQTLSIDLDSSSHGDV